jgi:hypothetical protein
VSRSFRINGECLVKVKGHNALSVDGQSALHELGLSSEGVTVTPRLVHRDVNADDFGRDVPADVRWMMADAEIGMTLIHYDREVLEKCLRESMGGAALIGMCGAAGLTLGRGRALLTSGCRFVSLNLLSPVEEHPWRFPAAFLAGRPAQVRLGTKVTGAVLSFRAIPYRDPNTSVGTFNQNLHSSGAVLWDHTADDD